MALERFMNLKKIKTINHHIMKKHIKILVLICWMAIIPVALLAQNPPHPNGGGGPGGGNTPVGGGAPIDGGLVIMLVLGSVYAAKKRLAHFKED